MPLPSSGPLSLNNIQTEFGGTNPIGMNEYYAGGGLVPAGTTGTFGAVPSSGALSVQNFYGTSAVIPVYIEEVFSNRLYTGTGATQTITNGINLSANGGLVWIKDRTVGYSHSLFDTARGPTYRLYTNGDPGQVDYANSVTSFNSNGFTTGGFSNTNASGSNMVSWTFQKQPKFFDVVTYTGNGAENRDIAHSIGGTVGCVIIKKVSNSSNWNMACRTAIGSARFLFLNVDTGSNNTRTAWFNNSTFKVGTADWPISGIFGFPFDTNQNGATYVAYIFAHNAGGFGLTGTDNVISCGEFETDGSGNATVNLGYEPQWALLKYSGSNEELSSPSIMLDTMRGWDESNNDKPLRANSSVSEGGAQFGTPTATGFSATTQFGGSNRFIYIAIRRGPMKVPTTGTSVFSPILQAPSTYGVKLNAGFPVSLLISGMMDGTGAPQFVEDRLRGVNTTQNDSGNFPYLSTSTNAPEVQQDWGLTQGWDNTGFYQRSILGVNIVSWAFQRAPGFFDEVCYTGTGANRTVAHNLGVVPELMIVKRRETTGSWRVYAAPIGPTVFLGLNETAAAVTSSLAWDDTTPTSTVFSLGAGANLNASGGTYINYLFASCPGVSKVGSYTGTGTTQTINCGFTAGSRFVLIKSTSASGEWYVWDSARGIVAGNDPYLRLNIGSPQTTGTDWVDTAASGFELSNSGGNLANSSGVSYIFLAIA